MRSIKLLLVVALASTACGEPRSQVGSPAERNTIDTQGDDDQPDGDSDEPTGDTDLIEGWSCDPKFYGGEDGCDCGCGLVDPDCAANGKTGCAGEGCVADGCDYCYDADTGESGACEIGGWTCSGFYYNDGQCDCGCGIADPDCGGGGCTTAGCEEATCAFCFDGTSSLMCGEGSSDDGGGATAPEGWTCAPSYYAVGDGCDCGCGIIDPDCGAAGCFEPNCTDAACYYCSDGTGSSFPCGTSSGDDTGGWEY